jgi:biopolymer transport protein ExbB
MGSGWAQFWSGGDNVTRFVALLLLAMSLAAWVLILWKAWVLGRAARDVPRGVSAFWAAPNMNEGRERLARLDRENVLLPLVGAAMMQPAADALEAQSHRSAQLTRRLREALHGVLQHLRFGQVVLASIGATAPFVGLLGTVWGIYHALKTIAGVGMTIDQIAAPVGEALIMTAAGLAVAIPAVLGYNFFGQRIAAREADLEGFAHDLRELLAPGATPLSIDDVAPSGDRRAP